MTNTRIIQDKIAKLFSQKLRGEAKVEKEWNVARNRADNYNPQILYAPRLDVAISPFMINYVNDEEIRRLENAFEANKQLIEKIKEERVTFEKFEYNRNPRCLIAVEIEATGSRKHHLGDIANASILGKIGLIVPMNEKSYRIFHRIMKYLEFAQKNNKTSNNIFKNIVLITSDELVRLLESMA